MKGGDYVAVGISPLTIQSSKAEKNELILTSDLKDLVDDGTIPL
jgi:hypothetical protein